MAHAVRIDGRETRVTPDERLETLKARYVPTPDNQSQLGDGDLNKFMARDLYVAAKEGDVEKFIDALENVCESRKLALLLIFDQVTPSGNSLLHVAASSTKDDVTELIISHYPDHVTRKNFSEDTPLHVAIREGRFEATKMLIERRRDSEIIYCKNKDNKSSLYLAAENCGYWDWLVVDGARRKILELLLQAFAQDEAYANKIQGRSPVLAALEEQWKRSVMDISPISSNPRKYTCMLEEIIDRLPKLLHVRNEDGGTPLHSAASVGNFWAVELLLERCPDLALQTDKNGSFPIHVACEGYSLKIIRRLIKETWPDLAEIKNKEGQNVLHVAAKAWNNLPIYGISQDCDKAVIEKMANSKDVNGNTPLHLASMHNRCRAMLYLTREIRCHLGLLNNDELTALDVAMKSKILSTRYTALLGRTILITAGVPRSEGQDVWSPREHAKWMKDQVDTRLLVATLVATVTFAAGFTLPGGYNVSNDPHPGRATMLYNEIFQVFLISNVLAMYSSILAVVVLLWGHMSDFYIAEQAYLTAGPLLLIALIGMSVAFLAGVTIAVSKLTWLAFLVLSIAVFFLLMLAMVLAALIFPFSKTAMHIVSLYYMGVSISGYAVRHLKIKNEGSLMYFI